MRCITYAGQNVITSNDVASTLLALTAVLAKRGQSEAVRIPIVFEKTGEYDWAELVVGVGNDVLSIPHEWEGEEVDFTTESADLRRHLEAVRPRHVAELVVGREGSGDGADTASAGADAGPEDATATRGGEGTDPFDRFFDIDIRFDDGTSPR